MKWYLADGISAQQKKRPASGDVFIGNTPEEAVAGAIAEFDRQIQVLERQKEAGCCGNQVAGGHE